MIFQNRVQAGRKLARALGHYAPNSVVVFALPRGGVVVGAEVADILKAPLELIIPRKIGLAASPEYAIGAVTENGKPVWNTEEYGYTEKKWRDYQVEMARLEAKRRRIKYGADQSEAIMRGKTAIIVDDGIATGLTMISAINELQNRAPQNIVVAVPVAPSDMPEAITSSAELVALYQPPTFFGSVGMHYKDFHEVTDEEVRQLMRAYSGLPSDSPIDLEALNAILTTIDRYPVKSGKLARAARRLHSPVNVVSFFESIPKDILFADRADVMRRSEEVELLMEQEAAEPDEELRSYGS